MNQDKKCFLNELKKNSFTSLLFKIISIMKKKEKKKLELNKLQISKLNNLRKTDLGEYR